MELHWGLHGDIEGHSDIDIYTWWKTCMHYYIPALGVVNIMSVASVILLPDTLNVVVTMTV